MPILIGGGGFGGGGGRQTVLLSGSPFNTLALLETYSQANPSELFNNTQMVALAVVTSDPDASNNGTYEYTGGDQTYTAGQWVMFSGLTAGDIKNLYESNSNTNAFTDSDNTAVTSVRGLTNGRLPIATSTGLADSGIRDTGDVMLVDKELQIPSGSLLLDELLTISEDTGFIGLTNNVTNDRFSVIDSRHDRANGSYRPQNFFLTEGQSQQIIQSDDSVQITSNDFTFNYTTQLTGQTNILEFKTYAPLTNVRVRVTDTVSGVVFKHIPNRAAWDSEENGIDFPVTGDNSFDLEGSTLRLAPNRELTFEVKADQAGFLGSNQTTPYLAIQFQPAEFRPLAWQQDIEHPVTLRRDMPTEEDAQELVDASLNQNSALWVVANDQLVTSNRPDAIMNALRAGLLDADGNEIPTSSVAANTIRLRGGSIVRVFAANNYRVVSVPTSMTDMLTEEDVRDVMASTLRAGNNVNILADDDNDTITISSTGGGGTPTSPNVSITRFVIVNEPTSVLSGTTVSGTKTFQFNIDYPDRINGNLSLVQGVTLLRSDISPTSNSFTQEVNSIQLQNNQSITFTLTGTSTDGDVISKDFTIRAHSAPETLYYGLSDSNNPSTIDVSTLSTTEAGVDQTNISTGTTSSGDYFIILTPTDQDIRVITDTVLQQDVTSIFVRNANVRTIGSTSYNSYVVGALNAGVNESYILEF